MLISCPKCNFSQPKDQYCASCGIDMRSYKAPRTPWTKRILKHPLFPILLLLPLAYAYYLYQQEQHEESLRQRVEYLTGETEEFAASVESEEAETLELAATTAAEQPAAQDATTNSANTATTDTTDEGFRFSRGENGEAEPVPEVADVKAEALLESNKQSAPSVFAKPSVTIVFAEVTEDFLRSIHSNRSEGSFKDFGDYGEGQARRLKEKLDYGRQTQNVRVLDQMTLNFEKDRGTRRHFSGGPLGDGNNEVGLATLFALNGLKSENLSGEIELILTLPLPGEPVQVRRDFFSSSFLLGKDSGFYLTGMIPPPEGAAPTGELKKAFSLGVLKILLSEDFRLSTSSGLPPTEFAIFILLNDSTQSPEAP